MAVPVDGPYEATVENSDHVATFSNPNLFRPAQVNDAASLQLSTPK